MDIEELLSRGKYFGCVHRSQIWGLRLMASFPKVELKGERLNCRQKSNFFFIPGLTLFEKKKTVFLNYP